MKPYFLFLFGFILSINLNAQVSSVSETFEAVTENQMPAGWNRIMNTGGNTGAVTFASWAYAGVKSLQINPTGSGDAYVFLPLTINARGTLNFFVKSLNGNAPLEIGSATDNTNLATYTPISSTYTVTGSYQNIILDLNTHSRNDGYVVIKTTHSSGVVKVHLDNVNYSTTCLFDIPVSFLEPTDNSIEMAWTTDPGTSVDIQVAADNQPQGSGTLYNTTSNSGFNITGLTSSTNYDVYVRINCPGGFSSAWVKYDVKTACSTLALTNLNEGFETSTSGQSPRCWFGTAQVTAQTFVNAIHTGSVGVVLDGPVSSNRYLVSPKLDFNVVGVLKFYARNLTGTAPTNVYIGTVANPNDFSTFVPFDTISSIPAAWTQYEINYYSNLNSHRYIAIKHTSLSSLDRFAVDDVEYTLCATPTGSSNQYLCGTNTLSDLDVYGSNIQWYANATGGTPLPVSNAISIGTTYYASQTVNGCESPRFAVNTLDGCNSLNFDGVNDRVDLPASTHSGMTTAGTIEAWIKTSVNNTGYRALVVRSNYYGLFLVDNKLSTYVWGGGAPVGVTTYNGASLNDGQWHHVALTFQIGVANGTQMYLDGQPVGPAITLTTLATANNFQIGSNTTIQYYSGNIDDVKIWSRALTAQELTNAFNCISNGSTNLNGHYNFNKGVAEQNNAGITTLNDVSGLNNNGTLFNFALNGVTSNWVSGYSCTPNLCPTPIGTASQTFCPGATVGNLVANGQNIQWYVTPTGGTALNPSTLLVNGTIYYATQTTVDCESANRLAVTVSLLANPAAPTGAATQTICTGTVAGLVATGTNIQWYDVSTGGTPLSSSTPLINGNTYYATQTVGGCESSNRLGVTVTTVVPAPTGAALQSFCNAATVANLTATGSSIQWYAASTGGTALSTGTSLTNGTTYYASQTVSGCQSVDRFAVTVTINSSTAPTGSAAQTFCNPATVANLTATGTGIQWYATSTGGTPLSIGTALTTGTTYYASQTISGCESATRFAVTVTINAPAAPTGTASQTLCDPSTIGDLTASGTSIQWYSSSVGGTPLPAGSNLTSGTYYASQTVSGCESVSRFAVSVTIISNPSAPTGNATQSFCVGSTVADLVAVGTNVLWYDVVTGGTPISSGTTLINGSTYYASQTNSCSLESTVRLSVQVVVSDCQNSLHFDGVNDRVDLPAGAHSGITTSGTIEAWIKTNNAGTSFRGIVTREFHYGIFLNNNQLMSYNWTGSGSTGATTYTGVTLNDNQWHHVAMTFQNGVTNGSQLYIDGQPVGNTFTHFENTTAANFRIGTNGLSGQFFQGQIDNVKIWSRALTPTELQNTYNCIAIGTTNLNAHYLFNEGVAAQTNTGITTLPEVSNSSNNGTLFNFTLTGATSNWVTGYSCTPNLCPTPLGSANQVVCSGSTVADLVANGQNIQWYSTSTGGTALNPSTPLVNGNIYYATQTTVDCESASRLAVTVTLNALPSAPTGATSQTTCGGTLANLTVTGSNIQWYTAASGGSPLASNTPLVNGSTYYASQTVNSCESADRLAVTVTSETPPPTGAATQEYCSPSTLNSLPANVTGTTLKYYSAPSGGSPLPFNTPLVNGTTYYVSQTVNGCESVSRLAVTTIVYTFTSNVSAQNPQTFCNGATVANLVANATPGATISWFTSSMGWQSGQAPLSSGTQLVNSTTYYAGQSFGTNNLCKYVGTAQVQVVINATSAPTGSATQTFCNSATVANLSATGTGIQWYAASTGGTALSAGTTLTNGTTYYASQTVSGCESTNRLAVTVTINTPSVPTGMATQTFCSGATVGSLSATGSNIQWYAAASGGSTLSPSTLLSDGTIYYASQTVNGCESTGRFAVTAVFGIPSAPTGSAAQTFCNAGTVADLTAVGSNIQWYAASTGGTALSAGTVLTNGSTYYASQTSGGCESTSRLAVTVTINIPATPTGVAAQTFCNSATVADLTATGSGIQWYAVSTGGTALSSGTALTTGTAYYATQMISGCESANRFAVVVSINTPAAPIGVAAQTFCNSATVADLTATGSGIQWYATSTGGAALSAGTALTDGTTYYATQMISGCESVNRLSVTVTINVPATPMGAAAQTFCNSASVTDLIAIGSGIQWYAASTGGPALTSGTALTTGTTYYASQTISGCESANRLAVTVTINAPTIPTGAPAQTFCNAATAADLTATGSGIQWYAASTGGTVLSSGTALTTGTTYYASQTISGCESANRFGVTVTINAPAAPAGAAAQTFCNSGTVADLTATGSGIQWYAVVTGGTALTSGTALTTGTTYYASQTVSGCESVNRLEVTATINAPAVPTGASTQTVCSGAIVGDLFASGSNIQWYAAATGGSPLVSSTSLIDGLTYYASQTINGCESVNRFEVNVVFGILSAPTGSAAQSFCNSGTVADLTAVGSNIQWYTASTGGTALSAGTALTNGLAYYASQTSGACESIDRLEVMVTINTPAAPTGTAAQEFCNAATVADLSATGSGIQWYTAATGGSALNSTTPLVNGSYYASQTVSGCESASRFAVAVTMNIPAAPAGNTNQNFCGSALVSDITVTGSNITWYDAASAGNVLTPTTALVDGSIYYATQTINGCTSLNQLAVTVSINAIPSAPTGTATQEFCNSATIADLAATGTTVTWYASAVSTSPLTPGTAMNDGASYYATETANGCESTDRLEVSITINAPSAPTGNTTQSFCSASTVDDLSATGTSVAWYTSSTGGTPLAGTASLSNGTYYASQTINGCESANRLAVAVTVTILNANVTQSGITLTAAQSGANYTWVDCNNGNQPIAGANGQSYTPTANGSYAVEIDLNGCSVVSSCVQITSVGLEEDKLELITVQPNPTSSNLTVTVSQPTTAVITASNGAMIATLELTGETKLDVTNYAMGVYYIRTSEGQTVKFIKE